MIRYPWRIVYPLISLITNCDKDIKVFKTVSNSIRTASQNIKKKARSILQWRSDNRFVNRNAKKIFDYINTKR